MSKEAERLVKAIVEKRIIESSEVFNYLMATKALNKVEQFKKAQGATLFKSNKE